MGTFRVCHAWNDPEEKRKTGCCGKEKMNEGRKTRGGEKQSKRNLTAGKMPPLFQEKGRKKHGTWMKTGLQTRGYTRV